MLINRKEFSSNLEVSAISIGISSSASSLFQTISSTLQFSTKSSQHREVADRYSKIITKIKFEFIDHSNEDFMVELENQILDVQNMCKFFPPLFIYQEYKIYREEQLLFKNSQENNCTQTEPIEVKTIV